MVIIPVSIDTKKSVTRQISSDEEEWPSWLLIKFVHFVIILVAYCCKHVKESRPVVICTVPEYHQVMLILETDEHRRQVKEWFYTTVRHCGPRHVDIVIQGHPEVVIFQ